MKEAFYFSHDYNSRNDWKLVKVMMKHKLEWVWAFWCIVEMLYEEWWYLMLSECERIAFELRWSEDCIKWIVFDSWLFKNDWEKFWSDSIIERLEMRAEKSKKASLSAKERWNKKQENANALRTQSDSNAIKERKGKERKEKTDTLVAMQPNEYSESISFLKKQTLDNIEIPEYAENFKNDWIAFIAYWTEKGKTWKIRAEREPTFEIKRRFATWINRKKENYQKTQQPKRWVF